MLQYCCLLISSSGPSRWTPRIVHTTKQTRPQTNTSLSAVAHSSKNHCSLIATKSLPGHVDTITVLELPHFVLLVWPLATLRTRQLKLTSLTMTDKTVDGCTSKMKIVIARCRATLVNSFEKTDTETIKTSWTQISNIVCSNVQKIRDTLLNCFRRDWSLQQRGCSKLNYVVATNLS